MAGLFDIFSNVNAQNAANAQIGGLQAGYNVAQPALQNYYGLASGGLNDTYAQALAALSGGQQTAGSWLTAPINKALQQLQGTSQSAISNLTAGANTAAGALQSNYASALQPYLQNYNQAQGGVTQLQNALGFGGSAGTNSALSTLQNTPGYQFALNQGSQHVLRNAAQTGSLASGNTLKALQTQGQGQAEQTYNNYVSQLQPFLGASNAAAGGIGSTYTGLGSSLGNLYQTLGQNVGQVYTGLGTQAAGEQNIKGTGLANIVGQYTLPQATALQNLGGAQANINTSLGNNLANLGWQTQTGMGNAQANADLANNPASANMFNAIFGGGLPFVSSLLGGTTGGGGGYGGIGSSVGSGASNILGNIGFGYSGAPGFTTSDERVKQDIEPVGELYDGANIYRFRYIGDPTPRIGLMAQEVEQTNPAAVKEVGGIKMVDYAKATEFAAALAGFMDMPAHQNTKPLPTNDNAPRKTGSYTAELARFLEAA